jgi:mono/diheme cytochrome c family protein
MKHRRLSKLLLLLVVSACGGAASGDDRASRIIELAGNSARGEALYRSQCAACHGSSGEGGRGPRIADLEERAVVDAILSGPESMPSFAVLGDQDISDLSAWMLERL